MNGCADHLGRRYGRSPFRPVLLAPDMHTFQEPLLTSIVEATVVLYRPVVPHAQRASSLIPGWNSWTLELNPCTALNSHIAFFNQDDRPS